jgi:hypothetical protein
MQVVETSTPDRLENEGVEAFGWDRHMIVSADFVEYNYYVTGRLRQGRGGDRLGLGGGHIGSLYWACFGLVKADNNIGHSPCQGF